MFSRRSAPDVGRSTIGQPAQRGLEKWGCLLVMPGVQNLDTLRPPQLDEEVSQPPWLPEPLDPMYSGAAWDRRWLRLFPAMRHYLARVTGRRRRYHLHESVVQRAVRRAVLASGITKPASCRTLRHSFATHMLKLGYDIWTIRELLGHSDVKTTLICTHALNRAGVG